MASRGLAAKQRGGRRGIRFPTGIVLWLDSDRRLQSEPPAYAEDHRAKHPRSAEAPEELSDFERFIDKLETGKIRV